jgi:hypothetical protein
MLLAREKQEAQYVPMLLPASIHLSVSSAGDTTPHASQRCVIQFRHYRGETSRIARASSESERQGQMFRAVSAAHAQ